VGEGTHTFGMIDFDLLRLPRSPVAVIRRGIHFGSYGSVDDGAAVFWRLAEAARAAEEAGFDAISVPDHVHQNRVGGGPASPMFEAYTVLGALARVTSSARLFSLVSPVTLRAPGLLAKAVTTLDVISGGRAVLGVGAGWDVAEHEAYGIDFPGLGERFDRLDEELAICRAMFGAEPATFSGKFYAVRDAYNSPRPVHGSIPVLVAGGGEKRTLDLVARYADACNVFAGEPADVRHKFEVLDRHCERIGRDPGEITRTVFAFDTSDLAALAASARSLAAAGADGMIIVGPADPAAIGPIGAALAEAFPG
jgi:F420-dependent oxidoreductase-like protein